MITDADALSAPPVMSTPRQRLKGAKKPGSCSRCGCVERLVWRWTVAGERGEGAGVAACVCERACVCVCVWSYVLVQWPDCFLVATCVADGEATSTLNDFLQPLSPDHVTV
jgi:hypothetical protein